MSNIYLGGASPPDYGPGSPSQCSDLFWSPSRISFFGQHYNTLIQNGCFWICSGLQFQIISWKICLCLLRFSYSWFRRPGNLFALNLEPQSNQTRLYVSHPLATEFHQMKETIIFFLMAFWRPAEKNLPSVESRCTIYSDFTFPKPTVESRALCFPLQGTNISY